VAPPRLRTMGEADWVAQERSRNHGGRRENTGGIKTGLREVNEGNNGGQYILFVVFEK
jgi:hypothetical protein